MLLSSELFQCSREVAPQKGDELHFVFINNGSSDGIWQEMTSLANQYFDIVTAVRLRRYLCKATALSVGFEQYRREFIFTIDADLKEGPTVIPKLLVKTSEGYDVVSG